MVEEEVSIMMVCKLWVVEGLFKHVETVEMTIIVERSG